MKKSIKSSFFKSGLILILSSILILSFYNVRVGAESGAYEATKKSLVRMVAKFYSSDGKMVVASLGTGFVIGDKSPAQYIVTNHHVISPDIDNIGSLKRKIFILLGRDDYIEVEGEAAIDLVETDIAVLKLKSPLSIEPVKVSTSENVKVTQEVYALGFPGDADINGITGNMEDITVNNGTISKILNIQWMKGVKCYQTNAAINSGNSGGPLVDKDGNVIGIVVAKKAEAEGIGIAIQIDELLPQLERRGIQYLKASASSSASKEKIANEDTNKSASSKENTNKRMPVSAQTSNGNHTLMIIGGIIIVVLLLSGLAIFMMINKKSKNKEEAQIKPKSTGYPMNQGLSNYDTAPIQNKNENTLNDNSSSMPISSSNEAKKKIPQRVKVAKLYGITGIYAGNEFILEEEALIMGRDPRICQVVFPENAAEVGRKHCVIKYNGKEENFVLEDCFSTNGTFVGNGEKLKPGISRYLRSGDRFYLSNTENLFEVRIE